jgi:hypothetical protein
MELIKRRNCEYNIIYQIAWCTKDRQPVLADFQAKMQMTTILKNKIEENGMEMIRISVGDDYAYVCVAADPKTVPVDMVKGLKGGSARRMQMLHPETCALFKDRHIWDDRYMIVAGDQDIVSDVAAYVNRQKKG